VVVVDSVVEEVVEVILAVTVVEVEIEVVIIEVVVVVQVMVPAETIVLIHTKRKSILIPRADHFFNNDKCSPPICTVYLSFFLLLLLLSFSITAALSCHLIVMMNYFGLFFALHICVCVFVFL